MRGCYPMSRPAQPRTWRSRESAASDSHDVCASSSARSRTYIRPMPNNPGKIDIDEAVGACWRVVCSEVDRVLAEITVKTNSARGSRTGDGRGDGRRSGCLARAG